MSRPLSISALCLLALLLALAMPGLSLGEEHGHAHGPGEPQLAPAPSDIQRTPEQIEHLRKLREQAMAEARQDYAKLGIDPALAAKPLGFDDNGKVFEMGMSLQKAMTAALAGGNRCRLGKGEAGPRSHQLEVVTKDERRLSFELKERGQFLLIERVTMARRDGGLIMSRQGPPAAFYLMTFMRSL